MNNQNILLTQELLKDVELYWRTKEKLFKDSIDHNSLSLIQVLIKDFSYVFDGDFEHPRESMFAYAAKEAHKINNREILQYLIQKSLVCGRYNKAIDEATTDCIIGLNNKEVAQLFFDSYRDQLRLRACLHYVFHLKDDHSLQQCVTNQSFQDSVYDSFIRQNNEKFLNYLRETNKDFFKIFIRNIRTYNREKILLHLLLYCMKKYVDKEDSLLLELIRKLIKEENPF